MKDTYDQAIFYKYKGIFSVLFIFFHSLIYLSNRISAKLIVEAYRCIKSLPIVCIYDFLDSIKANNQWRFTTRIFLSMQNQMYKHRVARHFKRFSHREYIRKDISVLLVRCRRAGGIPLKGSITCEAPICTPSRHSSAESPSTG